MEHQVYPSPDTNASFQDYNSNNQPPLMSIPSSSSTLSYPVQLYPVFNSMPPDEHADVPQHQRTLSEPTLHYGYHQLPQESQLLALSQRQRTLSAGSNLYYAVDRLARDELPPAQGNGSHVALESDVHDFSWMNAFSDSTGHDSLTGSGWPAEIAILNESHASSDQPLLDLDMLLQENVLCQQGQESSEASIPHGSTSYSPRHTLSNTSDQRLVLGESRIEHQTQSTQLHSQQHVRRTVDPAYMRRIAPHPYGNARPVRGAIRNRHQDLQRSIRSQRDKTRAPENELVSSTATENSPTSISDDRLLPRFVPERSVACEIFPNEPDLFTVKRSYVDVSVQTDPETFHPTRRHSARRTEARGVIENGQVKTSSRVSGSHKGTSVPKPATSAQVTPRLVPLAPRPQATLTHSRPTVVTSGIHSVHDQDTLTPSERNQAPVHQGGFASRPDYSNPSASTSATFSVCSTLRVQGTQHVHGLFSPFTPDSAVHHAFDEQGAGSLDPQLISQKIPYVSWHNSQANVSSQGTHWSSGHDTPAKPPLTPASSFHGIQEEAGDASLKKINQGAWEPRADCPQSNQNSRQSAQHHEPSDQRAQNPLPNTRQVLEVSQIPAIIVSQADTLEISGRQTGATPQPGHMGSRETSRPKRKRSTSLPNSDEQARKQRGESPPHTPEAIAGRHLEPPAPQTIRSNTQPFNFNDWLIPEGSCGASDVTKVVDAKSGDGRNGNVNQQAQRLQGGRLSIHQSSVLGVENDKGISTPVAYLAISDPTQTRALDSSFPTCSGASNSPAHRPQTSEDSPRATAPAQIIRGNREITSAEPWNSYAAPVAYSIPGYNQSSAGLATQKQQQGYPVIADTVERFSSLPHAYIPSTRHTGGGGENMPVSRSGASTREQDVFHNHGHATPTQSSVSVTGSLNALLPVPYPEILADSPEQHTATFGNNELTELFNLRESNV